MAENQPIPAEEPMLLPAETPSWLSAKTIVPVVLAEAARQVLNDVLAENNGSAFLPEARSLLEKLPPPPSAAVPTPMPAAAPAPQPPAK